MSKRGWVLMGIFIVLVMLWVVMGGEIVQHLKV